MEKESLYKIDKNLLTKVLTLQGNDKDESQIKNFIKEFIKKEKLDVILTEENDNIYVTKGSSKLYPCVVSHMDQVHQIHRDYQIFECDDQLFAYSSSNMSQVGIGGDDLVGVYICLQLLKDLSNVKAVFFTKEEVGCVGSNNANMSFFNDCTLVLQADRRGNTGLVTNAAGIELCSNEYLEHIGDILDIHQYKAINGSVTDVRALKLKGLDICCNNIECGYYSPHTDNEIVVISDVESCYNLMYDIITKCSNKRWLHTYIKPENKYNSIQSFTKINSKSFDEMYEKVGWNKTDKSFGKQLSLIDDYGYSTSPYVETQNVQEDELDENLLTLSTLVEDLQMALDDFVEGVKEYTALKGKI